MAKPKESVKVSKQAFDSLLSKLIQAKPIKLEDVKRTERVPRPIIGTRGETTK